jgi:hypothetical protein
MLLQDRSFGLGNSIAHMMVLIRRLTGIDSRTRRGATESAPGAFPIVVFGRKTRAICPARWKTHAAALLERQGIPAGVARERDLRQMFITGATPEQAVEQGQVAYRNTRPAFEPMRPKR